jgi:hypothetical protein
MSAAHQKFDDVQVGGQVNALSLALNLRHLISASYTTMFNGFRRYHLKLIIADSIDAVSILGMLVQLLQKLCGSIVETCSNCLHVTRNNQTRHIPICVTLKPMVLRGNFRETRVWSMYSSILYVVMVVGMPLSVVGAPSVMQ